MGFKLIKKEGVGSIKRAKEMISQGKRPINEISQGLVSFLAGVMLIVPGIITDILGCIVLVSHIFKLNILSKLSVKFKQTNQNTHSTKKETHQGTQKNHSIIEGEFSRIKD